MERIVVIGAGLGGLETAYILSRMGYPVQLLEACPQVGGALQTYRRRGFLFDAGFHYVGGLDPHGSLYPLFRYFHLLNLPWRQLDIDAADIVCVGGRRFHIPQGHSNFVETLSHYFPDSRSEIEKYTALLKTVGDNIFNSLDAPSQLFSVSAHDWLCDTISDPLLRKVLSGTSLKMQLDADTTPLYVFAQINNSFIQSSWRLDGGGETLCNAFVQQLESFGCKVRTNARVTRIIDDSSKVTCVEVNGNERIEADIVISDLHPSATYALMPDSKAIRRITRNRMNSLSNSFGMFTVNCVLKQQAIPYLNSNVYIYDDEAHLWNYTPSSNPHSVLVNLYPGDSGYAHRLDLLTPMAFSEVEQWKDSSFGSRPVDYLQFKKGRAEALFRLVETQIPGFIDSIDSFFTSTPLTYEHYTSSPQGSAFGVLKDWHSPLTTLLSPVTPVKGLLLTGQNLNLHGILGVSMTSLFTVSAITGLPALRNEIGLT
ncbi:MAG: NAD(P)/FAD-dependent oxidoreductase [Paludibacteraceae bacterium]|nr:NAD(P)/FAD-dependent oxidoreductase [Paludibacteraceae bacterium]